jgi:hypothetical protein
VSTAYLSAPAASTAWTTAAYVATAAATTVTISTAGSFAALPAARAYQLKLLNGGAVAGVTVNGAPVAYNRFGAVASKGAPPPASQWYWEHAVRQGGMGPVIDVVGASTSAVTTVVITWAPAAPAVAPGAYGVINRAIAAKAFTDLDRSTPASTSPGAAYMSVLASTGEMLTHLAGDADATAFAAALSNVTFLNANAITDVNAIKSPRKVFALQLLQQTQ